MFTAWVERKLIGAEGAAFALDHHRSLPDRGPGDLVLPGKALLAQRLIFIYPRWHDQPGGVVAISVSRRRRCCCWPCCGVCVGGGAGRWRGCSSLPARCFRCWASSTCIRSCSRSWPITSNTWRAWGSSLLASAGAALLLERWGLWRRPGGYVLCLGLLAILAGLSFRQSRMYADVETLYRTTIASNPDCWMAHNNLGLVLAGRGRIDEAIVEYQKALTIKPTVWRPRTTLVSPGWPRADRRGHRRVSEGREDRARQRNDPQQSWPPHWLAGRFDEAHRPVPVHRR